MRWRRYRAWKIESYADYVAQESSLSDADYAALKATGSDHPAMPYYEGRKRVAEILVRNGGAVEALFTQDWRAFKDTKRNS